MGKHLIIFVIIYCTFSLHSQSCTTAGFTHFSSSDINSIFINNNCQSCHNKTSEIWDISDYETMMSKGKRFENLIVRGDAGNSNLINVLNLDVEFDQVFQKSDHRLEGEEIKAVEAWINSGAPEECIPLVGEIYTILDENGCINCHNNSNGIAQWTFNLNPNFYQSSTLDCGSDEVINLYNPETSSLIYILENDCEEINALNHQLPPEEIIKIKDWIGAGGPVNEASLPLELVSFEVRIVEDKPLLSWVTTSELGVEIFIIERSDGMSKFEEIGRIDPTSDVVNFYSFTDENVSPGNFYYRIKIKDYDGRHEYSPIEYARVNATTFIFSAFPNPAINDQMLYLEWYSKNDIQTSAKMSLMNVNGAVIKVYPIEKGINRIFLPQLPQGLYYLTIEDYYGGTHFERLVVYD